MQAQLGGSGRSDIGSYNAKASQDLQTLLEEMPMKDCDVWIAALLKRNELLGTLSLSIIQRAAQLHARRLEVEGASQNDMSEWVQEHPMPCGCWVG